MPYIIEVEGTTGVGKTTMIPFIKKYFEGQGLTVEAYKEPGSTELGEKIRSIIIEHLYSDKMDKLTQMFLFLANRADLHNKKVKDSQADIILFDRYLGSTWVYQAIGMTELNPIMGVQYRGSYMGDPDYLRVSSSFRLVGVEFLNVCMRMITGHAVPVDSTFLLTCNPEVTFKRIIERDRVLENLPSLKTFSKIQRQHEEHFKSYLSYMQSVKQNNCPCFIIDTNTETPKYTFEHGIKPQLYQIVDKVETYNKEGKNAS